jgi:ADP-ribosylation factor 1/2
MSLILRYISRFLSYLLCTSSSSCCSIEKKVFILTGLDAAGKSKFLNEACLGEIVTTIPTIGFKIETIDWGNNNITCWDVGGSDKVRKLWRYYLKQDVRGLIFFVDSSVHERFVDANDELHLFLSEEDVASLPLLVVANKVDMPNAWSTEKIVDALNLQSIRNRHWSIVPASCVTGDGIADIKAWISTCNLKIDKFSSSDVSQRTPV